MKVTKKEQWAPITIELETAEELKHLARILCFVRISTAPTCVAGNTFACELLNKLEEAEEEI